MGARIGSTVLMGARAGTRVWVKGGSKSGSRGGRKCETKSGATAAVRAFLDLIFVLKKSILKETLPFDANFHPKINVAKKLNCPLQFETKFN